MNRLALACLAVSLGLSAGCKPDEYTLVEITGKVMTCDGKPATGGTVIFSPIADPSAPKIKQGNPGRESRGVIGPDGSFSVATTATISTPSSPGAIAGRHRVTFEMPPTETPKLLPGERAQMKPDEAIRVQAEFAQRPVYPKIDCSSNLEPKEVTVSSESREFSFTLTK